MSRFNSLSDGAIEIALETIKDGDVVYYDNWHDDILHVNIEQYVIESSDDLEGEYHITLWDGEPVYFTRYKRDKR